GLTVCRYPLEAGDGDGPVEPVWKTDMDDSSSEYTVLPVEAGREHVVVTAKENAPAGNLSAYVLSKETGEVLERIDLLPPGGERPGAGGDPNAALWEYRRRVIGPAVMMNGRLVVESVEGVRVYAGR
ncbi:MAG: hypothetical protein ACP5HU_11635, partial [Phycisphaerae bacterium]